MKRSILFIVGWLCIFLLSSIGINMDITSFLQREEVNIPAYYFYWIFMVDFLLLLALVLIFFHRKWGVFLFPIGIFLHFNFHIYFLSSFLYFDLFTLFIYSLFLMEVVVNWKNYK